MHCLHAFKCIDDCRNLRPHQPAGSWCNSHGTKVTIIALGPVYQTLLVQFRLFWGDKTNDIQHNSHLSGRCHTSIQWCAFWAPCTSIWSRRWLLVSSLTFLAWKRRCHTAAGLPCCLTSAGHLFYINRQIPPSGLYGSDAAFHRGVYIVSMTGLSVSYRRYTASASTKAMLHVPYVMSQCPMVALAWLNDDSIWCLGPVRAS